MAIRNLGNGQAAYTVTMPRMTHATDDSMTPQRMPDVRGIGMRSMWPLLPVGEAAQRDPHVPDPVPGGTRRLSDQRYASPGVPMVGRFHAGGGAALTGAAPYLVYIKQIGTLITRSLSRNLLMGVIDARWRVGGQGYPVEAMMGAGSVMGEPGYHGDSTSVDPDNKYNPQVTMRNPGVRPIAGVPASFRYAPVSNTLLYGQYQGKIQSGRPATNH